MLKIITGVRKMPDAILLEGVEGVGKTTFAAAAPMPVFICAEDGLGVIDVPRFEKPKLFRDVLDSVRLLRTEPHDYQTLVIDSLDWLEPLVWQACCEKYKWDSIESPGYGKGYVAANDQWQLLKLALDHLREDRGMQIILISHVTIRTFNNPSGPDYSRFEPALAKQAAALWVQWADSVLFACFEETIRKDSNNKAKANSTGNRVVHTVRSAGWTAKTRWAIPPVIPLDWADYEGFRDQNAAASKVKNAVLDLIAGISDPKKMATAERLFDTHRDNPEKMAALLVKLTAISKAEEE